MLQVQLQLLCKTIIKLQTACLADARGSSFFVLNCFCSNQFYSQICHILLHRPSKALNIPFCTLLVIVDPVPILKIQNYNSFSGMSQSTLRNALWSSPMFLEECKKTKIQRNESKQRQKRLQKTKKFIFRYRRVPRMLSSNILNKGKQLAGTTRTEPS